MSLGLTYYAFLCECCGEPYTAYATPSGKLVLADRHCEGCGEEDASLVSIAEDIIEVATSDELYDREHAAKIEDVKHLRRAVERIKCQRRMMDEYQDYLENTRPAGGLWL